MLNQAQILNRVGEPESVFTNGIYRCSWSLRKITQVRVPKLQRPHGERGSLFPRREGVVALGTAEAAMWPVATGKARAVV